MNKLVLKRLSQIAKILTIEGFEYLVDELNLKVHLPFFYRFKRKRQPVREELPIRTRKILEKLGGGFIKLGQLLSLRPDLVPNEFCEEFRKLQDRVDPFPFYKVKAIIREELKQPTYKIFSTIERKPLGSASIGQVHFAKLRNGQMVVVKVQRPNIERVFEADIDLLYFIARRLEKRFRKHNFSPMKIVNEFERYSKEELDYLVEAEHIQIFYENFKNSKKIVIPKVYRQYSTSRMLVIGYLDGQKLSELIASKKRFNRIGVALSIFDLTIRQTFQTNIFHADLHPGNILVMDGAKIGLIDFGITGSLPDFIKEQGIRLYIALLNEDVNHIYEAIITVATVSKETNLNLFKEELTTLVRGWNSTLKRERVSNLLYHIFNLCLMHKIGIPANLVMLAKALLTAEGTCLVLYPHFDFVEESKPYIVSLIKGEIKSDLSLKNIIKKSFALKDLVEKIPTKALAALDTLQRGSFELNVEDVEIKKLGRDLALSGDRISIALVAASFIVAGALIFQINPAPTYFGYSIFGVITFLLAVILIASLLFSFLKKP